MSNERFVRWQGQTIAQLSTALTLISGSSVGGLGVSLSLLREKEFNPAGWYALAFLVPLAAFFMASATGVAAVITRLLDFRLTAQKVHEGHTEEPLTFFGANASAYGKATGGLFWITLVSFSLAVVSIVVVVLGLYVGRIIP